MSINFVLKFPKLSSIGVILCVALTGCVENNKSSSPTLNSNNHPTFTKDKVATSNHYKPTGQITTAMPKFTWPKTLNATKYLLGHEDAAPGTRWHEYTLTADQANCSQTNDTSCSYTPDDVIFEQHDEKAWWIKPYIPGATTQWSDAHVFTYTGATIPPPTVIIKPLSPSPKTATSQLNPLFVWTASNNNISKYQIGFEDAAGAKWASFIFPKDKAHCDIHQCSYTLTASQTKFKQGDIKTWWIRSFSHSTWNDWSVGSTFNIDTTRNPKDLLVLTDDKTSETRLLKSLGDVNFVPKNTSTPSYRKWLQAITILDNGFYLMSQNIKVLNPATGKKEDTYILFNLLAPNGKSIANKQLDYASHGQDLSVEKVSDNQYYVYTRRDNGKGIARFLLDTTNIDFNSLPNNYAAQLNISHNKDIVVNNKGASTPTLNFEQDKFAIVSYISRKVLDVQVINKETLAMEHRFKLDLSDGQSNGNYNQGIAMKDNIIYIARGDWGSQTPDNIKKLYLLNATSGELISSFSFTLQNAKDYKTIEPEGLVIIENRLFIMLPIRKDGKVEMKLYKLLDI